MFSGPKATNASSPAVAMASCNAADLRSYSAALNGNVSSNSAVLQRMSGMATP